MFCLGCGSEITTRAEFCPVCGQRIGETLRAAPAAPFAVAAPAAPALPAPPSLPTPSWRPVSSPPEVATARLGGQSPASGNTPHDPAPTPVVTEVTGPIPRITTMRSTAASAPPMGGGSIRWGDLDGFVFPRDTTSRIVLLAAAAIVVSMFLPWYRYLTDGGWFSGATFGFVAVSFDAANLGAFRWGMILVALGVGASAFWASHRRHPLVAVAPFGVGAFLLGVGCLDADRILATPAPFSVSIGVGLYLFLLGAAALLVAGYRLLMAAVAIQQVGGLATLTAPPTYPTQSVYLPDATADGPSMPGASRAAPPAAATPDLSPTPSAPSAPQTGAPLRPGDPRWDEAPAPPTVIRRPAYGGGWGRGGVARR